jgi:hypothetical protein
MISFLAAPPAADGILLRAVEAGIGLGLSLLGLGLTWRGVPIGVLASLAPPIGSSPEHICLFVHSFIHAFPFSFMHSVHACNDCFISTWIHGSSQLNPETNDVQS